MYETNNRSEMMTLCKKLRDTCGKDNCLWMEKITGQDRKKLNESITNLYNLYTKHTTQKSIQHQLYDIYRKEYTFPGWSLQKFEELYSDFARYVTVYFDDVCEETEVKAVVTQRETVNIAMNRYYNKNVMEQTFGWSTGYYGDHFAEKNELAPNVCIYCKTPVRLPDGKFVVAHVANAVGYAFI